MISPVPFLFFKIALAIQGVLCFNIKFRISSTSFVENDIGNLIGITLSLHIAVGSVFMLTVQSFPIQEHGIASIDIKSQEKKTKEEGRKNTFKTYSKQFEKLQ